MILVATVDEAGDMATRDTRVRALIFSVSLRTGSYNNRLAELAARCSARAGADVDLAHISDWPVPMYDADTERADGPPPGLLGFTDRLAAAHALVIASPEYNASFPANIKNLIDWASRLRPQPLARKQVLLMSASPSMSGGNRGLWALRVPLEHLGARVYPEMFSLAQAHQAFEQDGDLKVEALATRFSSTITEFLSLVEASVHYPCAKQHWIEFLGEVPDPAIDRVE